MGTKTTTHKDDDQNPSLVEIDNEDFGGSNLDDDDSDLDLGNDVEDDELDQEPEPPKKDSKDEEDLDSDDSGDGSDSDGKKSDDDEPAKKDADDEDADDGDDKDADDDEPETRRVPVSRLNKEIDKRRKLEQQLEEMRKSPQSQNPNDVEKPKEGDENRQSDDEDVRKKQQELDESLEQELNSAFEEMLDGDTTKATRAVMQAIQKNREESQRLAEQTSSRVYETKTSQSRQEQELMDTATRIVGEYPELNSDNSETFNPDIFDEVIELRNAYMNSGMAPAAALEKSAGLVMKSYGVNPSSAEKDQDSEVTNKEPAKKDPKTIEEKLQKRSQQPPRTEGDNDRKHEKTSVSEMAEKDFDQLSDEELARLRGDIV